MRRDELFKAVECILRDLTDTELDRVIEETFSSRQSEDRKTIPVQLVEVFIEFSILVKSYSDSQRSVLDILGLEILSSPQYWSKLLQESETAKSHDLAREVYLSVKFAKEHLPVILQWRSTESIVHWCDPPTHIIHHETRSISALRSVLDRRDSVGVDSGSTSSA